MSRVQRRIALVLGLVGLLATAGLYVRHRAAPGADRPIVGMVRQTEIAVEPDISGRIADIAVQPGDVVKAGQVLARLSNPEVSAALEEAHAAAAAARAARDNLFAGPRTEVVASLARNVDIAAANLTFAREEKARSDALAPTSFVSRERIDQVAAALGKAVADVAFAQAALAEAKAGPTPEDRAKAEASVAAADAAVATAEAQLAKTVLLAPRDGVVSLKVGEIGEAVSPGQTILTISPTDAIWFGFTIREDKLNGLHIGQQVTLASDAAEIIAADVVEIRPLGEFAVWRATKAMGEHDLTTLWVRLDPVSKLSTLEAGMTVTFAQPQR